MTANGCAGTTVPPLGASADRDDRRDVYYFKCHGWYRGDGGPVDCTCCRAFETPLVIHDSDSCASVQLMPGISGSSCVPSGFSCELRVALPQDSVQVMVCEKSSPSILVAMLGDIGTVMGESM